MLFSCCPKMVFARTFSLCFHSPHVVITSVGMTSHIRNPKGSRNCWLFSHHWVVLLSHPLIWFPIVGCEPVLCPAQSIDFSYGPPRLICLDTEVNATRMSGLHRSQRTLAASGRPCRVPTLGNAGTCGSNTQTLAGSGQSRDHFGSTDSRIQRVSAGNQASQHHRITARGTCWTVTAGAVVQL